MAQKVATITLNNGVEMPMLGLGVLRMPPEETGPVVGTAISKGYRLIDTAAAYLNEAPIGEAIAKSGVDRSEFFIATKVPMGEHGYNEVLSRFEKSRAKLGADYVDLYLLHWPVPTEFDTTIAAYKAMEKLLTDGKVRAIGVCNFSADHLRKLIAHTDVVPAINQIEVHPSFSERELCAINTEFGIVTQAWSPIGGTVRRSSHEASAADPLKNPALLNLALKYQKTPAQIVLRWHIDNGRSAIPKSVRAERLAENIDIFDFTLSSEDLSSIDALDTGIRSGADPETMSPKTYPIKLDD